MESFESQSDVKNVEGEAEKERKAEIFRMRMHAQIALMVADIPSSESISEKILEDNPSISEKELKKLTDDQWKVEKNKWIDKNSKRFSRAFERVESERSDLLEIWQKDEGQVLDWIKGYMSEEEDPEVFVAA